MTTPAASASSSNIDLAAIKRSFTEDGYFVIRGCVSKGELESVESKLRQSYEDWKRSSEHFQGGGMLSGHLNCYPGELARGVHDELKNNGTLELLQGLFPTDPKQVRWGCNFNLPGSVVQHYHIDGLFTESYPILNVAVVDTDLINGAIDVIPKTHKRFYKYWEFATGRVSRGAVRLPMSRGDVLIRLSTLWHRGMPNQSQTARPMLALTLGEKEVNNADPFAYNDGKIQFQANWFKTNLLGQIRERTTIMAPITYSAYRFAHSLVSNKGYASF
jgi:hypothetical protein